MTETLLHKLEEKMMIVLSEVETLRKEIKRLHEENAMFRHERDNNTSKLEGLVALFDTLGSTEPVMLRPSLAISEPVVAQG